MTSQKKNLLWMLTLILVGLFATQTFADSLGAAGSTAPHADESLTASSFLWLAYRFIWLAIFAFIATIAVRYRRLDQRLWELQKQMRPTPGKAE